MTPDDLAAIRARDADAEKCAVCHYSSGGPVHDLTADQCSAEKREEDPRSAGCIAPADHHPFTPSGEVREWCDDEATADRRALLAEVGRLTARDAIGNADLAWDGGIAAERARIRAAVEGLPSAMQSHPMERVVNRAAVLAAIDGEAT